MGWIPVIWEPGKLLRVLVTVLETGAVPGTDVMKGRGL